MMIEAGQVAVVTGAAQGLGRALAAAFIDRGVSVALADTAQERLREAAEAFTRRGGCLFKSINHFSRYSIYGAEHLTLALFPHVRQATFLRL
jgi:NAD(P)-dependent dehydrogenase (short-subunit alcohol dehydrogenase family)